MTRALFASTLLLLLACGLSWGASAAELKPLDGVQGAVPMAKPTPPPPPPSGPCTISCYLDPTITCTSQVGDCHHPTVKGLEWINCDGHVQVCPGL
ncbi:MAG: hypothetical protein ABUT39_16265 [Acidobacteriota bacterium]